MQSSSAVSESPSVQHTASNKHTNQPAVSASLANSSTCDTHANAVSIASTITNSHAATVAQRSVTGSVCLIIASSHSGAKPEPFSKLNAFNLTNPHCGTEWHPVAEPCS